MACKCRPIVELFSKLLFPHQNVIGEGKGKPIVPEVLIWLGIQPPKTMYYRAKDITSDKLTQSRTCEESIDRLLEC